MILSRAPGEIIVGCIGRFHRVTNQQLVRLTSADAFERFTDPRYQKLAMSVRVERPAWHGARLVLEHRTHALGRRARWAFALYWVAIAPLGDLVSWLLLRATRRRAERTRAAGAPGRAGAGLDRAAPHPS